MAGVVPRDLGPGELDDPGLRGLLRLATDYDETALTRLVVEELPALVVLAVFDDDRPEFNMRIGLCYVVGISL